MPSKFIANSNFDVLFSLRMEEDLARYAAHPGEYTVSSKKLKDIHLCSPRRCKAKKPGQACFRDFYKNVDTSAIYHVQDSNISHKDTVQAPSVKVIPVKVDGVEETLVNGVPFIDKLESKFSSLEPSKSWGEVFGNHISFWKDNRSPSYRLYQEMEKNGNLYSITVGETSEKEAAAKVESFKTSIFEGAEKFKPFPRVFIALDVEGKRAVEGSDIPMLAKIHLGDGFSCFLEINFPMKKNQIPRAVVELFETDDFVFVGNDCTEDLVMVEYAVSTLTSVGWEFKAKWIDTAALWVGLGKWAKNSFGLSTLMYQCLGGFLPKSFKLSCAPDWTQSMYKLPWQYTVYNIGDQFAIIAALHLFFMTAIQTIVPDKERFVQKLGLDESESANLFVSIVTETFTGVCLDGAYYQGAPAYLRDQAVIQVPIGRHISFRHRMKENESPRLNKLINIWGKPVSFIRSSWMCKEESKFVEGFLGICRELKFCEYADAVMSPEDVSEDEVMILNASEDSEIIELDDHVDHVEDQRDHVEDPVEKPIEDDVECELMPGARVSRFLKPRPVWNPSGYAPTKKLLKELLDRGVPHVAIDRHGVEYTRRARNWTEYLSIKEMLKEVRPEKILKFVDDNPITGLEWIHSATEWGKSPTPTNFRFMGGKWYRDVVRVVEKRLRIKVENKHPYNKIRGGRNTRRN